MQQDLSDHYAATAPGRVQVLGVDLWNGTPAQLDQFRLQTGASYPLALSGASLTGGNVEALYGTYDNYIVLDGLGIVRYHAALLWPHGNRYHLAEIRAAVDNALVQALDVPAPEPRGPALRAGPVPSAGAVRVVFELPRNEPHARVGVFDVAGREVARLWDGPLAAGSHALDWDGRDARGTGAPAGLYWARAVAGPVAAWARVVRTR